MNSMTKAQIFDFRESFDLIDRDGDGHITKAELGNAMRSFGCVPSDQELAEMMKLVDIDGDGTIDFVEYVTMVTQLITDTQRDRENLLNGFELFDKDRNGHIDAEELRLMLNAFHDTEYTPREIDWMINQADSDGDNQINFHEFMGIMRAGLHFSNN